MPKTRQYRLLRDGHSAYDPENPRVRKHFQKGDIIDLTDNQYKAFRDKFEPVTDEKVAEITPETPRRKHHQQKLDAETKAAKKEPEPEPETEAETREDEKLVAKPKGGGWYDVFSAEDGRMVAENVRRSDVEVMDNVEFEGES